VYRLARFHAISQSTRDDLMRRGVASDRIHVIYPGVDAEWFTPDASVMRAATPTFLYVGRLKRYKGLETAVRAVAEVGRRGCPVRLAVAGDGDDRDRLTGLVRRLGLAEAVTFLGFVPESTKRTLLRQAWAVVLPSAKEGWGISNIEAAACGTPALAADRPGLRESVRHEETGLLVPHGDVGALADAFQRLARHPDQVARFGAAARRFAETFSWDRAAADTEAQLLMMLNAAPPERRGS